MSSLRRMPSDAMTIESSNTSSTTYNEPMPTTPPYYGGDHRYSFLVTNSNLIDDLSIIGDMYDDTVDESPFDKEVADVARHVARKYSIIRELMQSECEYLDDLGTFQTVYGMRFQKWFDLPANQKNRLALVTRKNDLDALVQHIDEFIRVHRDLYSDLNDRLLMWGPTQLVSDIFVKLYSRLSLYKTYMQRLNKSVTSLDALLKISSFSKFLESCASGSHSGGASPAAASLNGHQTKSNEKPAAYDILYYLRTPLDRIIRYTHTLSELLENSVASHPDYRDLVQITEKFKIVEEQWADSIEDCAAHLLVLDAYRNIINCPATVTPNRRLYLKSSLTRINLLNPSDVSDVRTYVLYSDMLIFCREIPSNTPNTAPRLQYKGSLPLVQTIVRPLAPKVINQLKEAALNPSRKNTVWPTLKLKKNTRTCSESVLSGEIYGFEIMTPETQDDYIATFHQNYRDTGPVVRRRHILCTESLAEQNAWLEMLQTVLYHVNSHSRS